MKASLNNTSRIDWRFFRMLVRWLLFFTVLLFILSGYGISNPSAVESVTFGLITKSIALSIHNNLIAPLALLMFLHILPFFIKLFKRIMHKSRVKHNSIQ